MAKSRFGRGKGGRKGKGKGRGKGKGHRGKGTKEPPPEIEVPESSQSSAAPSNVHADVNQPSASPLSSMENRVGRSDGVGSVAMPPVEGVESDALDEASGLQSSSPRAPNADAGFADGVQTDLPMVPVPPPESPCLDEVPCPEVVPAGSCDEIQLQPDYPVAPASEPAGSDAEEPRPHDAVVPGDPVEPAGSDAVEPPPHHPVVPVAGAARGPNVYTTPQAVHPLLAPGSSIHLNRHSVVFHLVFGQRRLTGNKSMRVQFNLSLAEIIAELF